MAPTVAPAAEGSFPVRMMFPSFAMNRPHLAQNGFAPAARTTNHAPSANPMQSAAYSA